MKKALPALATLALLLFALFYWRGRFTPTVPPYIETRWLMGTQVSITLAGLDREKAKAAANAAFAPMESVDGEMARREGTMLTRLNRSGKAVVSPALFAVATDALRWAETSGGGFDPTVGTLVDLWAVESGPHPPPSPEDIRRALERTGWRKVRLDPATREIATGGVILELGGIAKGFAIDEAAKALKEAGARNFIIDAGGDVYLTGDKNGAPWRIGVRNPRSGTAIARILTPTEGALVTSGDYERFFEWEGVRYSHILDPGTGLPATGVRSATVWAPNAVDADALATAICVLGVEKGLELVRAHPPGEALAIGEDGVEYETPGFSAVAPIAVIPQ